MTSTGDAPVVDLDAYRVKHVAASLGISRSSIHKWFPGGTPGLVHDPSEGK